MAQLAIPTRFALTLAVAASFACGGGDAADDSPDDPTAGGGELVEEMSPEIPAHEPREGIPADLQGTAPDQFRVHVETSKGAFVVEVTREWAPNAADRFYNLVDHGYMDGMRFFRTVAGFMTQFGVSGDPAIASQLREQNLQDEPVMESNTRGRITFAQSAAPNSRTTQMFINYIDNSGLDESGFAPFGEVVEGMDVVDQLHSGYGDGPPRGLGPDQGRLQQEGNAYLEADFPLLDHIIYARVIDG